MIYELAYFDGEDNPRRLLKHTIKFTEKGFNEKVKEAVSILKEEHELKDNTPLNEFFWLIPTILVDKFGFEYLTFRKDLITWTKRYPATVREILLFGEDNHKKTACD